MIRRSRACGILKNDDNKIIAEAKGLFIAVSVDKFEKFADRLPLPEIIKSTANNRK